RPPWWAAYAGMNLRAVGWMLGCVMLLLAGFMLLVAAFLEGFGRQMVQSLEIRVAIGWGIGLLWLLWAVLSGRSFR
ncbi:MAG: hypothetical protein ACPGID_12340, partial [Rubricella sp.]